MHYITATDETKNNNMQVFFIFLVSPSVVLDQRLDDIMDNPAGACSVFPSPLYSIISFTP